MISFSHSGSIGDILYSLYFCKELIDLAKQEKFNFHIQTNVKDINATKQAHPFGDVRMTNDGAIFLKSLLEIQNYINEVTISDNVPENYINLDLFRQLKINFSSGDIRSWYYNLSKQHLPRDFSKKIIYVDKNEKYKDKILFIYTERYQNIFIDYKVLEKYKDMLIFIGLEKEHKIFCEKYFNIEYLKCTSLKEISEYIAGAKGLIGNQSGLFSVAECLKIPRILTSPEYFIYNNNIFPGPVNNHPQGGWNEVAATNEKLINSLEELLKNN